MSAMMELTIKSDGEQVDLKVKNFMPKAMSVSLNRIFDELARKNGENPVEMKAAYLIALGCEFGLSIEVDEDYDINC